MANKVLFVCPCCQREVRIPLELCGDYVYGGYPCPWDGEPMKRPVSNIPVPQT